jgi:multidrug efflux pump subunit AcrA (membrane-fusion protein)
MSAPNITRNPNRFTLIPARSLLPSVSSLVKSAKYCGILAGLLAVGWIGHRSHWTFHAAANSDGSELGEGSESSGPIESVTAKKIGIGGTASGDWNITFPSGNSFRLSGIETSVVEPRTIRELTRATGVITYDERHAASLSARTTGTVWRVCKHVGETIRRGDVLVIVEAAQVGQYKAEFLSALVAREAKAEILSNLEGVGGGAIPQRQLREARIALRESNIRLLNAEQNLVNLGFNLRAEDFHDLGDDERAGRIQFLGLPETLTMGLDRDKTTSNLLPMHATFDGVVLRQDVALGETVEAGRPVLEIADTSRMWLKLDIPKEDASKLAPGQRVTFNPDGIEKDLEAQITWISTEMNEQTRTLQIRAEVDNPVVSSDHGSGQEVRLLRANTFGTGIVTLRDHSAALVVPVSAVLHDDRQPLVFVRTGDLTFERIDVGLGVRDGQFIEVHSAGLRRGIEVVSRGAHILKSEWTLNHVASMSP